MTALEGVMATIVSSDANLLSAKEQNAATEDAEVNDCTIFFKALMCAKQ